MRRLALVGFATIAILASAVVANAATETFFGALNGAQENLPVPPPGSGYGTAIYDSLTNTLEVDVTFSGLNSPTNNAHIHCCATVLTSTGVAIDFVGPGFPLGVMAGEFHHTFDLGLNSTYTSAFRTASGGTADGARDRLLNHFRRLEAGGAAVAYFNIHTQLNSPGAIRGNISPIPEPTSLVLAALGFAGLCWRRRR
jgi:hypothetical protein